MGRWGAWVRDGSERWDVVRRSLSVFTLNTNELMDVLNRPRADPALALRLLNDDAGEETLPFWDELDQRLHNPLSSAVSLIDHTRRLLNYYEADFPTVVADHEARNATIREMNETAFLRDLRNYLLHYGAAPVMQSIRLGTSEGSAIGYSVKLSPRRLLEWDKWSPTSRTYLSSFPARDGPVLGQDVAVYATAMSRVFTELLNQRRVIMDGGSKLDRFLINGG
jgi:hypothetical protein